MTWLLEQVIWRTELNGTEAWQKITGFDGAIKLGRMGYIPVYDGDSWTWFKNTATIWPGMEFSSDPAKVDKLRQNALELLSAFDRTLPELDRLGIKVKALLNKTIKTQEDVEAWANSIFNTGPTNGLPVHVEDALALMNGGFKVIVQQRPSPQYVLPAPGEGLATVDYNTPGSRTKFGPRHAFTKTALSIPPPGSLRSRSEGPIRPRGRPRNDGLPPGSREAKAADRAKQKALERAKAKRVRDRERAKLKRTPQPELATITELPRRRLVRVGQSAVST